MVTLVYMVSKLPGTAGMLLSSLSMRAWDSPQVAARILTLLIARLLEGKAVSMAARSVLLEVMLQPRFDGHWLQCDASGETVLGKIAHQRSAVARTLRSCNAYRRLCARLPLWAVQDRRCRRRHGCPIPDRKVILPPLVSIKMPLTTTALALTVRPWCAEYCTKAQSPYDYDSDYSQDSYVGQCPRMGRLDTV